MKDILIRDSARFDFTSKDGTQYAVTIVGGEIMVEEKESGILSGSEKAHKMEKKLNNL